MGNSWMLLWVDDDPKKPISEKIQEVMDVYQKKHGKAPNRCELPSNLKESLTQAGFRDVTFTYSRYMLQHHIGVWYEEKKDEQKEPEHN